MRRETAFAAAALLSLAASAQTLDIDWKEAEVPPPPALRRDGLVPVDVNAAVTLRYAIDPQSIAIGGDSVVRYVLVATSPAGAFNAIYEGLRCDRAEYRVYARSSGDAWRPTETEWRSLHDSGTEARIARSIARGGACFGPAPNRSPQQIVRDLSAPLDRKFGASGAP